MPVSGKKQHFLRWLDQHRPAVIDEPEFAAIRQDLAPISESYLRKLVRECGVPLTPMVEGVRQGSPDELEASLLTLLQEYEQGDRARQAAARRLVIASKDHARLALLKAVVPKLDNADRRAARQEAILWLTTWLENPPLFPEWVKLRRAARPFFPARD